MFKWNVLIYFFPSCSECFRFDNDLIMHLRDSNKVKGLSTLTITQVNEIQCILTEYCREQERRQSGVEKGQLKS